MNRLLHTEFILTEGSKEVHCWSRAILGDGDVGSQVDLVEVQQNNLVTPREGTPTHLSDHVYSIAPHGQYTIEFAALVPGEGS